MAKQHVQMVVELKSKKVIKTKLDPEMKITPDSALGHLTGKKMLIVGGCYNEELQSSACILDLVKKEFTNVHPLPFPCKNGQIHQSHFERFESGAETEKIINRKAN